jgi:hypothetical protein
VLVCSASTRRFDSKPLADGDQEWRSMLTTTDLHTTCSYISMRSHCNDAIRSAQSDIAICNPPHTTNPSTRCGPPPFSLLSLLCFPVGYFVEVHTLSDIFAAVAYAVPVAPQSKRQQCLMGSCRFEVNTGWHLRKLAIA